MAPAYEWFTEGFDTADLIAPKALLAALGRETVRGGRSRPMGRADDAVHEARCGVLLPSGEAHDTGAGPSDVGLDHEREGHAVERLEHLVTGSPGEAQVSRGTVADHQALDRLASR